MAISTPVKGGDYLLVSQLYNGSMMTRLRAHARITAHFRPPMHLARGAGYLRRIDWMTTGSFGTVLVTGVPAIVSTTSVPSITRPKTA